MQEMKEIIINEVDLLKENQDLTKELRQDCKEGCKFVFKDFIFSLLPSTTPFHLQVKITEVQVKLTEV